MTDDLGSTLITIVELLDELAIPYMIVGSIAAVAHGLSRATQDFDVVIEVSDPSLRRLLDALPEERFYASEDAAHDALLRETLFNIIDLDTGWKIDMIPRKRREFSAVELSRREELMLFGRHISVATLEDTIITKLEWAKLGGGSSRQLEDVRLLLDLAVSLDETYIARWIAELGLAREWEQARRSES